MKNISVFFFMLFGIVLTSYSQDEGPAPKESFIPGGWKIFQEAIGDLNKDSVADVAIVLESEVENDEGAKPRSLLILFKDKKTSLYKLACKTANVILDAESGGMMGDPLESMEIKKNVLKIDFFGGSSDKWSTTHRYRFQNNYFYVIGATFTAESNTGVTTTYDYNLSNGNIVVTIKDLTNKANNKTVNKKNKVRPLMLEYFEPEAVWAILMPKDYAKTEKCVLQEVGFGDCTHVIFSCGDFGGAETYLDEAGEKLWKDLKVETDEGEVSVNPLYNGKTFEIVYATKTGVKCVEAGPEPYQLIVGFKLLN